MGPLRNMRRKTSSRFPIPGKVGLKEASPGLAFFALSFVQIGKREGFFRGDPCVPKNHFSAPSKSNSAPYIIHHTGVHINTSLPSTSTHY